MIDLRRLAGSRGLHVCLIFLIATGVSAGILAHGWVMTDRQLLEAHAAILSGEAPLTSAFTYPDWGRADESSPNQVYHPVTIASLALDARLLGDDPAGMHAVNILLHSSNAVLVYLLLLVLFGRPLLALLAAAVFATHPIATEPVATLAGRAPLLCALTLLLALVLGLQASRRQGLWTTAGGLVMALATFMGALTEEAFLAAPLLMATVLIVDPSRRRVDARGRLAYRLTGGAMIAIQVFAIVMALVVRFGMLGYLYRTEPPSDPQVARLSFLSNPLQFAGPRDRLVTAARVAMLGAILLVIPDKLSADYSYNAIPLASGRPGGADLLALCFLAGCAGLLIYSWRRARVLAFALSWGALTYLMVSNMLFPLGSIFKESFLYLPSIGFATMVAAMIAHLTRATAGRRRFAAILAGALLIALGARFVGRCGEWTDDETILRAAVTARPASAMAHSNLALTFRMAGRYEEAVAEYRRALEISPGMTGSRMSLARVLLRMRRHGEAVTEFLGVIACDDTISIAWSGLGLAEEADSDYQAAERSFRQALKLSAGRNREALEGIARVMSRTGRPATLARSLDVFPASRDAVASSKSQRTGARLPC